MNKPIIHQAERLSPAEILGLTGDLAVGVVFVYAGF